MKYLRIEITGQGGFFSWMEHWKVHIQNLFSSYLSPLLPGTRYQSQPISSELLHVIKKLSLEPGDLCLGLSSANVWLYVLENVTLGLWGFRCPLHKGRMWGLIEVYVPFSVQEFFISCSAACPEILWGLTSSSKDEVSSIEDIFIQLLVYLARWCISCRTNRYKTMSPLSQAYNP